MTLRWCYRCGTRFVIRRARGQARRIHCYACRPKAVNGNAGLRGPAHCRYTSECREGCARGVCVLHVMERACEGAPS